MRFLKYRNWSHIRIYQNSGVLWEILFYYYIVNIFFGPFFPNEFLGHHRIFLVFIRSFCFFQSTENLAQCQKLLWIFARQFADKSTLLRRLSDRILKVLTFGVWTRVVKPSSYLCCLTHKIWHVYAQTVYEVSELAVVRRCYAEGSGDSCAKS
jgi:hypothetical protein